MMIIPMATSGNLGNHSLKNVDAAIDSLDIARIKPIQYTQPVTNPAPRPKLRSAYVRKEPGTGSAAVISERA
ncbi:hypothetical protein D3C81_859770 [compost metagenome]